MKPELKAMEERGYRLFAPEEEEPDKETEVFYNRKMVRNRDLSEVAGKVFSQKIDAEELRSCDALAGSGIRGLRSSSFSDRVFINDTNPRAVESIRKAAEVNGIEAEITEKDANILLSENRNFFHVIDIDPFGSFIEYLDSTARAANHQSFAGLTATDNAVVSGSYRKTCLRRYGSRPLKNSLMHETGLRIYIKEVFQNFARFDKDFDPKICWHERHYSRISGRINESKKRANSSVENIGYLSFCQNCRWRKLEKQRKCQNCGSADLRHAGPLWTGKFVDRRFTEEMLEEMPESWEGSRDLLQIIHNEAEILTPFYDLHELCSNLGTSSPKRDKVIEAIREKGYPVSRTHFADTGFRTDAPIGDVKEIIREQ